MVTSDEKLKEEIEKNKVLEDTDYAKKMKMLEEKCKEMEDNLKVSDKKLQEEIKNGKELTSKDDLVSWSWMKSSNNLKLVLIRS